MTIHTSYFRSLENGLTLKSVADAPDVERLARFNGEIFGAHVVAMTRNLILHHPDARLDYWLYVEDEASGSIVSTLGLIPWTWRYEDVTLRAGEMGIVATHPAYRNRGLVRALVRRFKDLLRDGEFDLSQIQGIPYFYRQFGYEYALPLELDWHLELRDIPDDPGDMPAYRFERAAAQHIPALARLYDEAARSLDITVVRSEAVWRYLFEYGACSEAEGELWLLLDGNGQIAGYCRLAYQGFGDGLIVSETSRLRADAAEAALRWLKGIAQQRGKPYIRFNLAASNDLVRAARGRGAGGSRPYEWQIHLVDVARLLRKLAPVLERRIEGSMFAGLTKTICMNLYREAFALVFEGGRLRAVNAIGFTEQGDFRLPPLLFAPLLLGYHSHDELRQMYPDVNVWGQARALVDVLFPKLESFIYTNY